MTTRKCLFLLIIATGILWTGARGHASDVNFERIASDHAGVFAAIVQPAGSSHFSFGFHGGRHGHGYSFGYRRHHGKHPYYGGHHYRQRHHGHGYYYDRYPYRYKYYHRPYYRGYYYRRPHYRHDHYGW